MLLRQTFPDRVRPVLSILLLLLAGLCATPLRAQSQDSIIVTGFRPTAPYVLQNPDGSLTGLEYELVLAAAQAGGLALKPEAVPFGRLPEDFRRGTFGAIMPANAAMGLPGCLSEPVLVYRNIAFSLAQRGLGITQVSDLAYYDVTAFQNAQILLGPEMTAMQQGNAKYREVANQMLQVRALFSGRTDVVIMERRIFRYLMRSDEAGLDTSAPVAEHDLFAPVPYAVAFRQAAQCAAFDRGLAALKGNGTYDAIVNRWDRPLQARSGRRSGRDRRG